ncbi:unnamed protein product [Paramecium sonneborni]|uniref:Jacalin-type lectin domain-containing protein n=1 Tax=Paramecium sonneborni TaxID=65129 RepID=A0A8S1L8S0_9CILI|nr:unnamed protein product [Paramecium sonneborni]
MLNKVPSQISFGAISQNSQKFDDKLQIKNSDFKIAGFKIYIQDEKICGIGIVYLNKENGRKIIFTDTNQIQKNLPTLYEFNIASDDYIQVIFGHYDQKINQLGIITYSGQQVIFGLDQGCQFNYMFMGYTFSACSGTFKTGQIESLNFYIHKLPKSYISQNLSPLLDILYPNLIEQNNHLQNTEQLNFNSFNFSELTIDKASKKLEYQSNDQVILKNEDKIKKVEYQGFDFQQVDFQEIQNQQSQESQQSNDNFYQVQKTTKNTSSTRQNLRAINTGVTITKGIMKLILHH